MADNGAKSRFLCL